MNENRLLEIGEVITITYIYKSSFENQNQNQSKINLTNTNIYRCTLNNDEYALLETIPEINEKYIVCKSIHTQFFIVCRADNISKPIGWKIFEKDNMYYYTNNNEIARINYTLNGYIDSNNIPKCYNVGINVTICI